MLDVNVQGGLSKLTGIDVWRESLLWNVQKLSIISYHKKINDLGFMFLKPMFYWHFHVEIAATFVIFSEDCNKEHYHKITLHVFPVSPLLLVNLNNMKGCDTGSSSGAGVHLSVLHLIQMAVGVTACCIGEPTFHWLSSVKISVSAMSTRFQVIASSSCLFQLSLPSDSLVFEAEWMWMWHC